MPPSLDELLLVRGVTREKLFGLDRNANFDTDDWEAGLCEPRAARQHGDERRADPLVLAA